MTVDVLRVLSGIARAMESVVPDLSLTPEIGDPEWFEDEWVTALGFDIRWRGVWHGAFQHASGGSEREQVESVARELMSQVQDMICEGTAEPWPLIVVNNRKDMAMADAAIEGDDLHLWYGDRAAPALKLPAIHLT
jgi:hypothetical protein